VKSTIISNPAPKPPITLVLAAWRDPGAILMTENHELENHEPLALDGDRAVVTEAGDIHARDLNVAIFPLDQRSETISR
jgi:hypothetical protein